MCGGLRTGEGSSSIVTGMRIVDQRGPGGDDALRTLRFRVRARRNMGPLVWGQAISLLGDYVAFFTLPLFVVSLTGRPIDLGITAAMETLPMILFGFVAGVFLDRRLHLRRTLVGADALRAMAFAVLALAAAGEVATPVTVYIIAFIAGTLNVVFDSGLQALMPSVLEEDMLVHANSRLALARTLAATFGPAIGGIAVVLVGFSVAFSLNALTFLISGLFLLLLRPVHSRQPVGQKHFGRSLNDGLRFLFREPRLRWATLGGTVTNLVFAPLEAILVLFVAEHIEVPDWGIFTTVFKDEAAIGLFFALQALIGSIGVAFAPWVADRMPLGKMYVLGLALMGGGFVAVALSSSFLAVIPAGITITGVTWVNVALSTLRQRLTPGRLLGRVIASSRTMAWIGLPIGAALGGLIAEYAGLRPVYLGGSATVLIVAVLLTMTPLYRDRVMADPTADLPRRPTPASRSSR